MIVEPSTDDRMAVMDRLLDPTWVERQRARAARLNASVEAAHRCRCEQDARCKLYGSRSGTVTPLGPDHPPTPQSDAPAVTSSRGA